MRRRGWCRSGHDGLDSKSDIRRTLPLDRVLESDTPRSTVVRIVTIMAFMAAGGCIPSYHACGPLSQPYVVQRSPVGLNTGESPCPPGQRAVSHQNADGTVSIQCVTETASRESPLDRINQRLTANEKGVASLDRRLGKTEQSLKATDSQLNAIYKLIDERLPKKP